MGQKKFGVEFFLHESSNWVELGLHAENQLPVWSGSGLKVCRVGEWWVTTHNVVIPTSNWLWLSWVLTISLQKRVNSLCDKSGEFTYY